VVHIFGETELKITDKKAKELLEWIQRWFFICSENGKACLTCEYKNDCYEAVKGVQKFFKKATEPKLTTVKKK